MAARGAALGAALAEALERANAELAKAIELTDWDFHGEKPPAVEKLEAVVHKLQESQALAEAAREGLATLEPPEQHVVSMLQMMSCFLLEGAGGVWACLTDREAVNLETCSKELLSGSDSRWEARLQNLPATELSRKIDRELQVSIGEEACGIELGTPLADLPLDAPCEGSCFRTMRRKATISGFGRGTQPEREVTEAPGPERRAHEFY